MFSDAVSFPFLLIPFLRILTFNFKRGRCNSNDQFISFEHDDTDVSADLRGFDWIGDVESFLCSVQKR